MNTIPSTFKRLQTAYTVVGGEKIDKKRQAQPDLSLVLLNRGGKIYRQELFTDLENYGIPEVISIEGPGSSYDIENLSNRFPKVKFLILQSMASVGEQVNIGVEEAHGKLILVAWNDLKIPLSTISSRAIERIMRADILCTVPVLQNEKMEIIPSVQVPAFYKNHLKVVSLTPKKEGMPTLYPFDYVGIYNKERFTLTGGFDHNLINQYWQKMDFGFRSYMWGESIICNLGLRLSYFGSPPVEDTTVDENYKIFFLKNLAVRFKGDMGLLPLSSFIRYLFKTGSNVITAWREFKEVRRWVELNKYRFNQDARSVTDLWEAPEE